jgi:hypothetical protein
VQFGCDEREHLDQPDPSQLAARRERRRALGDPAEDRDVLGQELPVIEDQRRDVALGIDRVEVFTAFGPFGSEIDPDAIELQAGLMHGDVIGEAARPRGEIELHRTCSLLSADSPEVNIWCGDSHGPPDGLCARASAATT